MDFLARREHGEQEITKKLIARGFDTDIVEAAISTLISDGLLSDSRFAEAFVYSRFKKGSGPQKIHAELRQRGIDDDMISVCMETIGDQWRQRVREVREKKFGLESPRDFTERSRQMRFLQQRGFTSEQIRGAFGND